MRSILNLRFNKQEIGAMLNNSNTPQTNSNSSWQWLHLNQNVPSDYSEGAIENKQALIPLCLRRIAGHKSLHQPMHFIFFFCDAYKLHQALVDQDSKNVIPRKNTLVSYWPKTNIQTTATSTTTTKTPGNWDPKCSTEYFVWIERFRILIPIYQVCHSCMVFVCRRQAKSWQSAAPILWYHMQLLIRLRARPSLVTLSKCSVLLASWIKGKCSPIRKTWHNKKWPHDTIKTVTVDAIAPHGARPQVAIILMNLPS